jgi:hypothetical protein
MGGTMRIRFLFLNLIFLSLTGCLGKLEDLTGRTKDEVELTRLTQTGGGVLELMSSDKSPSQIALTAFRAIRDKASVSDDELGGFLGCNMRLSDLFLQMEPKYTNVPYFSANPDVEADNDIGPVGLSPITRKQYKSFLNGMNMALMALAAGYTDLVPRDLGDRIMRGATALLGAREYPSRAMYDSQGKNYRIKGMKIMRGLAAQGIITKTSELEDRREKLLELSENLTE